MEAKPRSVQPHSTVEEVPAELPGKGSEIGDDSYYVWFDLKKNMTNVFTHHIKTHFLKLNMYTFLAEFMRSKSIRLFGLGRFVYWGSALRAQHVMTEVFPEVGVAGQMTLVQNLGPSGIIMV